MTEFKTASIRCPDCGTSTPFELVTGLDAGERPDLREAVLEGRLQREACPGCATVFRIEPAFTYVDAARGQYIGVWPAGVRPEWQDYAERTRQAFDRRVRRGRSVRMLVGQVNGPTRASSSAGPPLVEKLLAQQAGIDDRTLELAKIATLRHGYADFVPGPREFRLVGVGGGDLVFGWVGTVDGTVGEGVRVPRGLIRRDRGRTRRRGRRCARAWPKASSSTSSARRWPAEPSRRGDSTRCAARLRARLDASR